MKKVLAGAVIALASALIYRSCADYGQDKNSLKESSVLIQQQLQNVSKLIVTEGHFAEVYTYADSKELLGPMFTADKKALVVVNAKVTVAYDLREMKYEIDEPTRTLRILNIPEPEVDIHPDFEYYDVSADYLNPFKAEDYNAIKQEVNTALMKKIKASSLLSNGQNRLVSELSKLFVLTNSMGWELVYYKQPLRNSKDLLNTLD